MDSNLKTLFIRTLDSKYANLVVIGVFYLIENKNDEIARIYELFTNDDFFESIDESEILSYYSKELLAHSYSLLTNQQQKIVNQYILNRKKEFYSWTHKDDYTEKKVYSNYLKIPYQLISMLPDSSINTFVELKKIYQEGFRKYGILTNKEPRVVMITSGSKAYFQESYTMMSFDDWRNTFVKLSTENRSIDNWDKPTKEGNRRKFEENVTEIPHKFYPFIESLIHDKEISIDYIISGLEGLKKADFPKEKFQDLCLKIIRIRRNELDNYNLTSFIRNLRYIIDESKEMNKEIFLFIKDVIYKTPDRTFNQDSIQEDKGMGIITAGINSTRGVAVELLVECYSSLSYKDEIFNTLEYVADTANAVTRSCAIFRAAWLNGLDKERAFNLYLRLVKDYNPYLLAIPFHDGHPLLYHMNIDFKKLIPFFEKAITIEEAGQPMAFFLFNAYLNDRRDSLVLLKKLLQNNSEARQQLCWNICIHILNGEYAKKGWEIIFYLLDFDDKELGEKLNISFSNIPTELNDNLISFINNYLQSPLSSYLNNSFYDFLRKLIAYDAAQCLIWFFESKPDQVHIEYFYEKSPLNVLIEGYNGLRNYDKENPIIERAMDEFDSLLKIPHYRNSHISGFLSTLES